MSTKKTILVVDDEAGIRKLVGGILSDEGYACFEAATTKEAYQVLDTQTIGLVILDIWLEGSGEDGIAALQKIKAAHPTIPVIMISGHGTVETAVSAIKQGAYDFIEKPFKADRLLIMMKRAFETSALMRENDTLKNYNREQAAQVVAAQETVNTQNQVSSFMLETEDLLTYSLKEAREIFERYYLNMQVERFEGNISKTANFVGMERSALHRKLKSLEDSPHAAASVTFVTPLKKASS